MARVFGSQRNGCPYMHLNRQPMHLSLRFGVYYDFAHQFTYYQTMMRLS